MHELRVKSTWPYILRNAHGFTVTKKRIQAKTTKFNDDNEKREPERRKSIQIN